MADRPNEMTDSVETGHLIRSVGKAMAILQVIGESPRPLRVTDLAKRLHMSSSVVSRLVSTLEEGGLVEQEEDTGRCYLGFGLAVLGNAALGRRDLDRIAVPIMAEISARFATYVSLGRLHRGSVVAMLNRATESLQRDVKLSCVMPIHASAPGKVLVAWLDPKELNSILQANPLDSFTARTITSPETLAEELERVRNQGFAIDDQELVHGHTSVATPIRDHRGQVVAAISAGGPARQVLGEELEALTRVIAQRSLEISRQLGYDERSLKTMSLELSASR
jgi:IclR family acetate operon transcriptional repressor